MARRPANRFSILCASLLKCRHTRFDGENGLRCHIMVIYFGEQSSYTTYLVESDDRRSRRNTTGEMLFTL